MTHSIFNGLKATEQPRKRFSNMAQDYMVNGILYKFKTNEEYQKAWELVKNQSTIEVAVYDNVYLYIGIEL